MLISRDIQLCNDGSQNKIEGDDGNLLSWLKHLNYESVDAYKSHNSVSTVLPWRVQCML